MTRVDESPRWARHWLVAAGVYNLVWGGLVILWPSLLFTLTDIEVPRYPEIWQCVGMIVGVYGIGYLIAATDPRRHWPIILVGLLGKLFGPIGFSVALLRGDLPAVFGLTLLTNDLIWWIPFTMMLWDAARSRGAMDGSASLADALKSVRDQDDRSLWDLSHDRTTLVVLTRHMGCTFCSQSIADIQTQLPQLREAGLTVAVVSMSPADQLTRLVSDEALDGVRWISDPERLTYRAFEIGRGSFRELFGPIVWWRGLIATLQGHIPGPLQGDGFQMPGAVVLRDGLIIKSYRHRTASDRLDHAAFACEIAS